MWAESRGWRHALIQQLRDDGHLHSARVAAAIEAVPREVFVPGVPLEQVYRASDAIVTKKLDGVSVSSASAPEVVALMLEQLDPQPGQRVLEIGAGTGYNAALLWYLVGESGEVVTLDIDEDLVLGAREHLRQAGYGSVKVVQTDGALGYPDQRAFDRIILTVASQDIAPAWRDQLARPHGRLVLPLGLRGPQRCVAFKHADDHLVSDSMRNCAFIPLRGVLAGGSGRVSLDAGGGSVLTSDDEGLPISVEEVAALLEGPMRSRRTGISMSALEVREGLHVWLVTHQPGIYTLWGGARVPDLFGLVERSGVHGTLCCLAATGPALLAWADAVDGDARGGEVCVLAPAASHEVAEQMRTMLGAWVAAGRPMDAQLQVRAYARGSRQALAANEVAIERRWTRFVLNWAQPPAILTV
jgi:protein-L-isoaspartate(D-aspartate) O-methyltransferase